MLSLSAEILAAKHGAKLGAVARNFLRNLSEHALSRDNVMLSWRPIYIDNIFGYKDHRRQQRHRWRNAVLSDPVTRKLRPRPM